MDATHFPKRTYSWADYVASLRDALAHVPQMRSATQSGRISHVFAEKIMLAVTQVNGCRYCDYGHTLAALKAGVSEDDLQALRTGVFDTLPEDEVVALYFAQHYAERQGQPDSAAWQRLVDVYGPEAAQDILAYIRMIMIGNLLGNTFDAFFSRLRGRPAQTSTALDEVAVLGSTSAVLVLPLLIGVGLLVRLGRWLWR